MEKVTKKEKTTFTLTEEFNPQTLSLIDLKSISKQLGLSNQGRRNDLLERLINAAIETATVKQLQAVLKHNNQPHSGSKDELKLALHHFWDKSDKEAFININTDPIEKLMPLAGNDESIAKLIFANRPYSDAADLKKK